MINTYMFAHQAGIIIFDLLNIADILYWKPEFPLNSFIASASHSFLSYPKYFKLRVDPCGLTAVHIFMLTWIFNWE